MTKQQVIYDPNSCWNKAEENERMFILLGRDESTPFAIEAWIDHRLRTGKNRMPDRQIQDAITIMQEIMMEQMEKRRLS